MRRAAVGSVKAAVLMAATAVLLFLPGSATAGVAKGERFAEPMGDGPADMCLLSNPCDIEDAIEDASVNPGDIINLLPGDYTTLLGPLAPESTPVTIRAQPGGPRPRIVENGDVINLQPGDVIRGLYIECTSGSRALSANGSTVEQMVIHAEPPCDRGAEAADGALIRDSIITTNFGGAPAVRVNSGGATLAGVTAIGLGMNSDGIEGVATTQTIDLLNVIARGTGTGAGIRAQDDADPDSLVIKADRINHTTLVEAEPEADIQLTNGQTTAPLFVNAAPAVRDLHQLAGSVTIDAGGTFGAAGMFDVDGQVRVMGCAPDIGGDEFSAVCSPTQPPAGGGATTPTKKKKCKRKKKRRAAAAKKKCRKKKR